MNNLTTMEANYSRGALDCSLTTFEEITAFFWSPLYAGG